MKTNFNDIDELLVKYLTGEANSDEQAAIQQWLQAEEGNRKYYEHFRLIWEESVHLAANTDVDEQAAWQRFQQRTQQPKQPAATVRTMPAMRWMRVAAVLVLAAGLTWLAFYLSGNNSRDIPLTFVESTDEVRVDTLPDGSTITLNKNSSASWPQQFAGNQRSVQLSGEAFFSVKPDKEKPFIVNAGNNTLIEVLGTSFNVRTHNDSTEVIVETGRVQVSWEQQNDSMPQKNPVRKTTLKAGEAVVVLKEAGISGKQVVKDRVYIYYRNRTFVCESTPLWKLVEALNSVYGSNIVIERPGLRETPLSVKFENQPLDNILEVLRHTIDMEVVNRNDSILLR